MAGVKLPRPGRRFALICAGVAVALAAAVSMVGWYYSSLLLSDGLKPDYSPETLDLVILGVEGDRIVLAELPGESVDSLADSELWGLDGENGYGHVGAVLTVDGGRVTREFRLLSGRLTAGDRVRLDSFAFAGDPRSARGLEFRSVVVPSALGDLPAWKLDGARSEWVIFVHGWRSDREEALRVLPAIAALGLQSLVITYRNDEGAPRAPDGLIRFGATEWRDLEAAVVYATAQGAKGIVLYGYSMGGGIVMRFLQESARAGDIRAAVLDAPLLDFNAVLGYQASRRHIPQPVVWIGKQFAARRFDIDWGAMNNIARAERVRVPILLFHGDEDLLAPVEVSRRFAKEHAASVTYVEGKGAGHVRTWNVGPAAYEATVTRFLTAGLEGATP